MNKSLTELLECPACHGALAWQIASEIEVHIEQAEARCAGCGAVYPVMDGIGIFLTPDLPRKDMWEQAHSQLSHFLNEHPDLKQKLIAGPAEALSPTDQMFRAMILDEQGQFANAKEIEALALRNLYTSDYRTCWKSQIEYILESLAGFRGPVVDIASGRCYLVERIASQLRRPVIATDFSLRILRRNRNYFEFIGLADLVSFLAFNARKTPFKNNSIEMMTTNVGLPNIESPGDLLKELRRVVNGSFLAISSFYPAHDELNKKAIVEAGIEALCYKESTLRYFEESGWQVKVENACASPALPTPPSLILDGARADGLPVAPTELEWCALRAVNNVAARR